MKTGFRTELVLVVLFLIFLPIKTLNYNLSYYNWTHTWDPILEEVLVAFENTLDCGGEYNAIVAAANAWNEKGANFSFPNILVGNPQDFREDLYDGENQIGWVQDWEENPRALALTVSHISDDVVQEVDVLLNDTKYWSTQLPKPEHTYDVQSVMTHEFGHWLGLDHSPHPQDFRYDNVMRSSMGHAERREIQPDDNDGLFAIYNHAGWEGSQLTANPGLSISPDIAVGADKADDAGEGRGNVLHVVWSDDSTGYFQIHYRRHHMGGNPNFSWEPEQILTSSAGNSNVPRVATRRSRVWYGPQFTYQDHVYVVWCCDSTGSNEICFQRSIDGGNSWQNATRLTNNAGDSTQPEIAVSGGDSGQIHIVWTDNTYGMEIGNIYNYEIYYITSYDHGLTWCPEQQLSFTSWVPGYGAMSDQPSVAWNSFNEVYVVWRDNRQYAFGGRIQIYFAKSPYGELPWSPDMPVTQYQDGYGCFEPAIAISEKDKVVHLVFAREMPGTGNGDIIYLKSSDFGNSWGNERNLSNSGWYSEEPDISLGLKDTGELDDKYCIYVVWDERTYWEGDVYFSWSKTAGNTWSQRSLTSYCQHCCGVAVTGYGYNIQIVWSQMAPGISYEMNHLRNRALF